MRVFLTGATGFIGRRLTAELLGARHEVVGLARSDTGAEWLRSAGATTYHGELEDPDGLARGATDVDAVIHAAYDHDFSRARENAQKDGQVIEALGRVLGTSGRPLIVTSGTAMGNPAPGAPAIEDVCDRENPNPRRMSELTAERLLHRGVAVAVVRLPQVHDTTRFGLFSSMVALARATGVSAYVEDGLARRPAAHVTDVARLYRLALEHGEAGGRWHAVAEQGVRLRDVATAIGARLKLPVMSLPAAQAAEHFGPLLPLATLDVPASSAVTRKRLGWRPSGPDLLDDLSRMVLA